jgi:Trk K+ transport system NAD-binding subunit
MRVVILGAGRLGGLLIESLIGGGREVVVVERDTRVLERLEQIAGI